MNLINLDIRMLRSLMSVVETGSITETARRLGRTQPAITLQLQRLEELTGKAIFIHEGRRLFLTAKARPILGRVLNVANETRNEALALLSPAEAETLIGLLDRVHATLSERVPIGTDRTAVLAPPRAPTAAAIAKAAPEAKVPAVESAR